MDTLLYRSYLDSFLEEFEYDKADSAFLRDTYEKIISNDSAKEILSDAIDAYGKNEMCDYDKLLSQSEKIAILIGRHKYTTDLLKFLLFSRRLLERYAERGFSREIWHNTVLDLKYKLTECKLIKGTIGTFVAFWFAGFFSLERFAFGRLQFELVPLGLKYKELDENSKVIGVHIPRDGTPLDLRKCHDAYLAAKEWYKDGVTIIDGKAVFYCESWLLYPDAVSAMPEKSNVRRFFEQFEIIETKDDFSYCEMWRLFNTDERNPERLKADSSLRRIYVDRMQRGLPAGEGKGIFLL